LNEDIVYRVPQRAIRYLLKRQAVEINAVMADIF